MEDFQSNAVGKVLSHILGQGTCFTVKDGIVTVAPKIGIYNSNEQAFVISEEFKKKFISQRDYFMYGVNKALGGVVSFPQFDGGGLSALHMHNPNNGQSISNEDLVMKLLQYYADKITAETGLRDNVTAQDVYDLSGRDAELTEITLAAACFRIASSWSFKDIKEKTDDALEQKFTEQTADALGLASSVANIPDGTVSIERVLKKWQEFEDESEDDFKELLAGIRTAQVGKQIYHLLNSESIKS